MKLFKASLRVHLSVPERELDGNSPSQHPVMTWPVECVAVTKYTSTGNLCSRLFFFFGEGKGERFNELEQLQFLAPVKLF